MGRLSQYFFIVTVIYVAFSVSPSPVFSADSNSTPLIDHTSPTASTLPIPGKPLTLSIHTKKAPGMENAKAKAILIRDGLLLELNDSKPKIASEDSYSFSFTIPSPLAELDYHFVISSGGQFSSSKRYSVRRSCVPDVTLSKPITGDGDEGTKLTHQSNTLQRDIELYEEVLKVTEELQREFGKK